MTDSNIGANTDASSAPTPRDNPAPNPTDEPDLDALSHETATNDAVAGETILPGDSYAGATGAEPVEGEPELAPNELAGDDIDLDSTPPE